MKGNSTDWWLIEIMLVDGNPPFPKQKINAYVDFKV